MPDLFHYSQDLGKLVGARLGLMTKRSWTRLGKEGLKVSEKEKLEQELAHLQTIQRDYRQQIEQVNKIVHPFDVQNNLQDQSVIEKNLQHALNKIHKLGTKAGIEIDLPRVSKILNQIIPIAKGVVCWQKWVKEELEKLSLTLQDQQWLLTCALPYAYWQVHLGKTTSKKKDKNLKIYYQQRARQAAQDFEQHAFTRQLSAMQREKYINWAYSMASTFHRSSSQVEGRNGYLAFVHHAHKGIPEQRQKALTVVHNFDTKRRDGKTPAQRLFKRDFEDLFEFILENVTDLPLPRKRQPRCRLSC